MNLSRRSLLKTAGLAGFSLCGLNPVSNSSSLSGAASSAAAPASPFADPASRWWENPERLRSGRIRPSGIMNWETAESLRRYEREVAYVDCGTQRSINKLPTWEALAGGPLGQPGIVAPRSQMDWPGTPIGVLMDHIPPGKGWLIWGVWAMVTGEAARTAGAIWRDVAGGAYDPYYVDLGARARRKLLDNGWPLDCLLLRWNKEFNQEDSYGLTDGQRSSAAMPAEALDWYREAMGRVIALFDEGYGGQARHIFSPSRNFRLFGKPLDAFFTPGAYDLISLSYHPSSKVKNRDDWEKMLRGDLDGGYGDLEAIELCRKHGIPFCHDEWSPRFEPNLACPIPSDVFEWTKEFWDGMERAHGVPMAFDCVYHSKTLDPTLYPEWAAGVETYKRLWAGKKPPIAS
ncbi:MAG: hypothetical protein BWZ10_02870 [candidate division BRC1 bacterium ADurb.BinA364]|nr:MAG: hypothetical protein BWZ10_02870 [candidate division BRC1 bacterium ADurb.BinA364]